MEHLTELSGWTSLLILETMMRWWVLQGRDLHCFFTGEQSRAGISRFLRIKPDKDKWTRPKGIAGRLTSKDGETSACLSPDGKELYIVSRNSKLTTGGKDIMVSRLDRKGKWDKPTNLGSAINTPYDEEGVFISPDDRYLYFASQGHNSMGGYDIFRSERRETGVWSDPKNLGYPINTPDDEVFYITDRTGSYGYYSAIREGGLGAKDIYKVVFLGSEKELLCKTQDQLVAGPGSGKTGFLTRPELKDWIPPGTLREGAGYHRRE